MNNIPTPVFKWTLTCLVCLVFSRAMAQESVLTASDNASGSTGSVSYSIGQAVYHTNHSDSGMMTEGVQQPYEILFMTGVEDKSVTLNCTIRPNPAESEVKLEIDRISMDNLRYELRDVNGIILKEGNIETRETTIPVAGLATGIYMLSLIDNSKNLITWKVIKK